MPSVIPDGKTIRKQL